MQKRLLIVGSSGYSGQYITRSLASSFEVRKFSFFFFPPRLVINSLWNGTEDNMQVIGTYSTHCPPDTLLPRDRCYKVDLLSPEVNIKSLIFFFFVSCHLMSQSVETCFRKVDPGTTVLLFHLCEF